LPKPTQEELDDEEHRSRPIAYFNFAETYWKAAKALRLQVDPWKLLKGD
jgi:hypothetical protein